MGKKSQKTNNNNNGNNKPSLVKPKEPVTAPAPATKPTPTSTPTSSVQENPKYNHPVATSTPKSKHESVTPTHQPKAAAPVATQSASATSVVVSGPFSFLFTLGSEFFKVAVLPAGLTYAAFHGYRHFIIEDGVNRAKVASLLGLTSPSDVPALNDAIFRLVMAGLISVSFILFTVRMASLFYEKDAEVELPTVVLHAKSTLPSEVTRPSSVASSLPRTGMGIKRASTSSFSIENISGNASSARLSPSPSAISQGYAMPRIRKVKDPEIVALRETEYSRLDRDKHCYLDYTGGMLYPESLVRRHAEQLIKGTYGNPHSSNPTSHASTELCEKARSDVLKFFNADPEEYLCIFTSNASGALRIVGESFPFVEDSQYLLLMDNHNSVNGIREFALSRGAKVTYARTNTSLRIDDDVLEKLLERTHGNDAAPKLFAYPAQSNFSGVKHSLEWIDRAQQLGWYTLLDAAAFVPTSPLDLSAVHPDFVSMSFYKIFGYPTGVGCLLMRKRCVGIMQRPWFAGGTIKFVTCVAAEDVTNGKPTSSSSSSTKRTKKGDATAKADNNKKRGISPLTDSSSTLTSASSCVDQDEDRKGKSNNNLNNGNPPNADVSTSTICMSPTDLTQRSRATFPRDPMHVFAHDHEAFEDGTINYLSLSAVSHGLEFMTKLGMERVCGHIQALTSDLIDALSGMVHQNGQPMINILGPSSSYKRGGTVSINVVDVNGEIIPPMVVEKLANEQMISIRSGCFCNPGDSEILFPEAWKAMMELLDEGDPLKAREMGLGIAAAIRISVGIPTSDADIVRVIKFLLTFKNTLKAQYDHLMVCPLAAH